jgi:general secretion pathway protein E
MTTVPAPSPLSLSQELTREFLVHHRVCPLRMESDGTLIVGMATDGSADAIQEVGSAYGCRARAEEMEWPDLDRAIDRISAAAEHALRFASGAAMDRPDSLDELGADLRELANQPPVIRYVNALVRDAVEIGASDIHLETTRTGMLAVRLRRDGILTPAEASPPAMPHAVVSRIKLLAELDTAERRRPQDGRIRVKLDARDLDLRVSTVPTLHGESVVIRLLDQGGRPVELGELGMSAETLAGVTTLAERPNGMILVTGPTGSGKTTTLYSALRRRPADREKIITIEDPVEYQLNGIAQVPVHQRAGVTFGTILRSILRQDPDVIMVGEMRDAMTAEVAIQAAMTGHLVLSTLHTNDAIGAIARLLDLGVPDYLVAATLEGVLAQRLVRRICDACRTQYDAPPEQVALVSGRPSGRRTLTQGAGCSACRGTGYRGRVGLFELLLVDDAIKDAVTSGARRAELSTLAASRGMRTLRADGWSKVESGATTLEEIIRVTVD